MSSRVLATLVLLAACSEPVVAPSTKTSAPTAANRDAVSGQPDLRATAGTSVKFSASGDVDEVGGSAVLTGTRGYFFGISNQGVTTVTNATVTLATGWGLSSFPGIAALPIVGGPVTLAPGQSLDNIFFGSLCCTRVPSNFAEGFDSKRVVTPTQIGIGGGTQTVQVTVTVTDPALSLFDFSVSVSPNFSAVTLVSVAGPSNLDEGETVASGSGSPSAIASWALVGARLNKAYTFTATLQVPNNSGVVIETKPSVQLYAVPFATNSTTGPSASVFVPEGSLDGPSPGSGGVTFAVDQVETWQVRLNETRELNYNALLQRAPSDITPPVVTHTISGTPSITGWYASGVVVTFAPTDPESPVTTTGCAQQTVSATTSVNGVTFTCIATSAGGSTTDAVTIKLDKTVPTVSGGVTSGVLGANGWYTSDVGIAWTPSAAGPSGQTPSSDCATVALTSDTPSYNFTCTITSGAGIKSTPGTMMVKRDATKPVVLYAGNAGSYTVDQTVAITCSASDNLSGVASSICAPISGAAYGFLVGNNTYSATATDNAGNVGSATTMFTVNVTSGSLCTMVQRWVSDVGVANSLCVKLAQGNNDPFRNELSAQSGKKITAANAAILLRLVNALDPR